MDEMRFSIPAHRAIILWGSDMERPRGERISELLVCHVDQQPGWASKLYSSRGACDADWLNGDPRHTPLGIWAMIMTVNGFVSSEAKIRALREFTKIRGQEWTVALLREIDPDEPTDA